MGPPLNILVSLLFLSLGCRVTSAVRPNLDIRNLRSLQEPSCVDDASCDDGNPLTIDTCNASTGSCQHECDDGNACTMEAFVNGICQHVDQDGNVDTENSGVIDCDDGNPFTVDGCLPSQGCVYFSYSNLGEPELDQILEQFENEEGIFYEDEPSLTEDDVLAIINWIRLEVTQLRTPFCWKRSYGRGVGEVLTTCRNGKEKIGALCYSPCQSGYSRQGTFDCQQECKPGWRDDGLFCRLTEYGRGAGYPWQFSDGFSDSGMFRRCEADHGGGNCEKWGAIVYPKCRSGYSNFGCCICRPSFSSCTAEGYTNPRIDLSCAVRIQLGDPTPLQCRDGLEQDVALCYPFCDQGFDGVGPVCWQECDVDQADCGAGCARTATDCALAVVSQVLAPIIVAANIFTLGATSVPLEAVDSAVDGVTIGNKFYQFSTKIGKAFGWLAGKLQSVQPDNLAKGASVLTRIKTVRTGTALARANNLRKVAGIIYGAGVLASRQFAEEFEDQTSPEIAQILSSRLNPVDLLYIQRLWADVQYEELAEAEGWNTAGLVLAAVGLVDITGITGLIEAYAKPLCAEIFPFPDINTINSSRRNRVVSSTAGMNDPPEAVCQNVEVFTTRDEGCVANMDAMLIGEGSSDINPHDKLFYSLNPPGPYEAQDEPHTVIMTVTDGHNASDSCSATILVSDLTPSTIACPITLSQGTDPGKCSAVVAYDPPVVTDNCKTTSETTQTGGLPSGGEFPNGETTNTYQVQDSLGDIDECSFIVSIFDVEKPVISCEGLERVLETDPGECYATYTYNPPVATDNCGADTVLSESASYDPSWFPALEISTVEYTATDADGNMASCTFTVTVEDREEPNIICPADIFQSTDKGFCHAVVTYKEPIGTDNCPESRTERTSVFGTNYVYPFGESTVSYTATDLANNAVSCEFIVTISDEEAPLAECRPDPAGYFEIVGSDNCQVERPGLKAYVVDSASGTRFPTGEVGHDFYELGTTFKYTVAAGDPVQGMEQNGDFDWNLQGNGEAYIIIVDEAGNESSHARCVVS